MAIKEEERRAKFAMKVLVLGTSASGKSTVAKQMKILHCSGFSEEELHNYKQILILNIFNGMKELVFQAEEFGVKILRKNKKVAQYFAQANPYTETLNSETVELAKQLWSDKGTPTIFLSPLSSDLPHFHHPRGFKTASKYLPSSTLFIPSFLTSSFLSSPPTTSDCFYTLLLTSITPLSFPQVSR